MSTCQHVCAVVMEAKHSKKADLEPSGHTELQFPPHLDSCEDLLTQSLQNLDLQDEDVSVTVLDPSCLLTAPNTLRETEDDVEQREKPTNTISIHSGRIHTHRPFSDWSDGSYSALICQMAPTLF